MDVVLSVGAVADQVSVVAATAALQTAESTVSTLFETKIVNELPLNGRNFLQLQLLAPGVTMGRPGTFSAVQIAAQNTSIGGGNFSVNGMRDVYNDYLLDGVSFKDWIHGTNGMNPSVDAVQEFRTQTSNYSAEFGANSGAVVNMLTKSGTNVVHGSAYEYLRDDAFDAKNFFTNAVGADKPPMHRNQFGGAAGGPIFKNKTFFFGSYEGFREDRASTLISTLPTAKMHHGDFSELLALPDPVVIHDPATGLPYPGNVIPADQVLAVMPGYLDTYVPLPTRPGLVQNDVVDGSRKNETDQYIGRVDHTFGNNTAFFTRYAYNTIRNVPITRNPEFTSKESNRDANLSAQVTKTLGSSSVLEVRGGYNRFRQIVNQNHAFTTPNIAADMLQISGVATDPAASNAPAFIVPGYNAVSGAPSTPRSWFSDRYEGQANVSLVRGGHLLKAGLHIVNHHETFPEIIIPNGLYVFDGSFTGHSMADMLIGVPGNFLLSPELFDPQFRQTEIMPWIQDDWRVTPKLTVNLGLRYERRPWPVSDNNTISNIVLPPGGGQASVVLSGPCVPDPPVRRCETTLPTSIASTRSTLGQDDNNNFAPRIGFAYRVGDRRRWWSAGPTASSSSRNRSTSSCSSASIRRSSASTTGSTISATIRAGTGTTPPRVFLPAACSSPTFPRMRRRRISRHGASAFSARSPATSSTSPTSATRTVTSGRARGRTSRGRVLATSTRGVRTRTSPRSPATSRSEARATTRLQIRAPAALSRMGWPTSRRTRSAKALTDTPVGRNRRLRAGPAGCAGPGVRTAGSGLPTPGTASP